MSIVRPVYLLTQINVLAEYQMNSIETKVLSRQIDLTLPFSISINYTTLVLYKYLR